MTLKSLAATALRGTARAEVPQSQGSPLDDTLARVEAGTPEELLLARAALAGLHARAGGALQRAESPPPPMRPPAVRPLPTPLWPLLRQLAETPAAELALADVEARKWTLSAAQVLVLTGTNAAFAPLLWPLSDERGQAILDRHPVHAAWKKADLAAKWQAQLDTLRELRTTYPIIGAAQTFQLWQEVKADERRDILDVLENNLTPQDLPLLTHAEKDRSAEVQRRARLLQGHLPGPLQDELLALLPQAVVKKGNKLSFGSFELPEMLSAIRSNTYAETDLHRLLGALPFNLILQTLDVEAEVLLEKAEKRHWSLKTQLQRQQSHWLRGETPTEMALAEIAAAPDLTPEAVMLKIQLEGPDIGTANRLEIFALHLDPATSIPQPQPQPLMMPKVPKQLPHWQTRADWETQQAELHEQRQVQAEAAWRTLSETLRLRREWQAALEVCHDA